MTKLDVFPTAPERACQVSGGWQAPGSARRSYVGLSPFAADAVAPERLDETKFLLNILLLADEIGQRLGVIQPEIVSTARKFRYLIATPTVAPVATTGKTNCPPLLEVTAAHQSAA
jgi:hypothetical protein